MSKNSVSKNHGAGDGYEPQLVINEVTLQPGEEWTPQTRGWLLLHVAGGFGYWMNAKSNSELPAGSILLLSEQVHGNIRASQIATLQLQYFRIEPKRLTGLVTIADLKVLERATADANLSFRLLPPSPQLAERFSQMNTRNLAKTLPARTQLLQLFLDVFRGDFRQVPAEEKEVIDAKERLRQLLDEAYVDNVIELDFAQLVSKLRCSPRHVSRLFKELVGVSFREMQTELRLARACELLATTTSKVAVIAAESGYQSTSFFNMMFKQRFGINPTTWRDQVKKGKISKRPIRRWRAAS